MLGLLAGSLCAAAQAAAVEQLAEVLQVAVLEAGSANALSKWMADNGYKYPDGMDDVANEYVAARWCFVAVKANVGSQSAVEPKPGMRKAEANVDDATGFEGAVQAMAQAIPA